MSSELFITDFKQSNDVAIRPQSHDTRFKGRQNPRPLYRFNKASPDMRRNQRFIKPISFPLQIKQQDQSPPRPLSAVQPGNAKSSVGGLAFTSMRTATVQLSQNQIRQLIQKRLRDWFTQQYIKPNIQVKDKNPQNSNRMRSQPGSQKMSRIPMANQYRLIGLDVDLATLVNQQVIFLQPSQQQQFITRLNSQQGAVFYDDLFLPDWLSLFGQETSDDDWRQVIWGRMIDQPGSTIFQSEIEPGDIQQGMLGDCYYLAGLAALAERPQRIRDLFLVTKLNNQKVFACKIMYKGKWKTIYMDDYIPKFGNKSAFSQSVKNEIWVELLEKAWAKLYSSYKRIDTGYLQEGLHDLTGAHIKTIRLKHPKFDMERGWRYLATKNGYAMIGSTLPGSDRNIPMSGVTLGHTYTILSAAEINFNGQLVRLVQCRNPWSKIKSNLNWNDKDSKWNNVSIEEKRRIGYIKEDENGIFFIDYNDFCQQFRVLISAEIDDNASYVYCTQEARDRTGKFFKVEIFRQGDYSFQVNQIPQRRYPEGFNQYYKYVQATINIGLVIGQGKLQYFEGSQSAYRTLFKKHHLMPGLYIIYTEIQFDKNWQTDYEITLGIYGSTVCRIGIANPQQTAYFHENLFLDRAYKNRQVVKQGISYKQEILSEGFIYAAVFNLSPAPIYLQIQYILSQHRLLQNQNPQVVIPNVPLSFQKTVSPNTPYILLARVLNYDSATSSLCNISLRI